MRRAPLVINALAAAHRIELAEALGVSHETGWPELLERVRRLRSCVEACPCGARTQPGDDDCEDCESFWCAGCERWLPWALGGGDDAPHLCDVCRAAPVADPLIAALGPHPSEPCS